MSFTEPTRRAVAHALEKQIPCDDCGLENGSTEWDRCRDSCNCTCHRVTPADLEALNRAAAEAQGWVLRRVKTNPRDVWFADGEFVEWAIAYTPTTNDGQALAFTGALTDEQREVVIVLLRDWLGRVRDWILHPDRPALLTAAAVLASRGGE